MPSPFHPELPVKLQADLTKVSVNMLELTTWSIKLSDKYIKLRATWNRMKPSPIHPELPPQLLEDLRRVSINMLELPTWSIQLSDDKIKLSVTWDRLKPINTVSTKADDKGNSPGTRQDTPLNKPSDVNTHRRKSSSSLHQLQHNSTEYISY